MLTAVTGLLIPVAAVLLRHRQRPERPILEEPELLIY
jgi:hypothetical protein